MNQSHELAKEWVAAGYENVRSPWHIDQITLNDSFSRGLSERFPKARLLPGQR